MTNSNYPKYQRKPGDHWIEKCIFDMTEIAKEGSPSNELRALIGVARGIRAGHITQGDPDYIDLALKATVDGKLGNLGGVMMDLGDVGLFSRGPFGGKEIESRLSDGCTAEPIPSDYYDIEHPREWAGFLLDTIEGSRDSVEVCILVGVLYGVMSGSVRNSDPKYAQLVLDAASKRGPGFKDTVEIFGELGFFGKEPLPGCEPEKTTAVSRLR